MSCDTGPGKRQAAVGCLRLAGRRKRPCRLRVQSCLSRRGSRRQGCFGSGCFRGFLRSGFFCCFLGGRFFRRGFLGGRLLRWRLFRCCLLRRSFPGYGFFRRSFFRRRFFGRSLLRYSLLGGRFFRHYFFGRSFLRSGLLGRRFFRRYFFSRSFLRRCGLFCGRFFRSCHHFLLDQIAKSTSCLLVCMKRSMVLEQCPAP